MLSIPRDVDRDDLGLELSSLHSYESHNFELLRALSLSIRALLCLLDLGDELLHGPSRKVYNLFIPSPVGCHRSLLRYSQNPQDKTK